MKKFVLMGLRRRRSSSPLTPNPHMVDAFTHTSAPLTPNPRVHPHICSSAPLTPNPRVHPHIRTCYAF